MMTSSVSNNYYLGCNSFTELDGTPKSQLAGIYFSDNCYQPPAILQKPLAGFECEILPITADDIQKMSNEDTSDEPNSTAPCREITEIAKIVRETAGIAISSASLLFAGRLIINPIINSSLSDIFIQTPYSTAVGVVLGMLEMPFKTLLMKPTEYLVESISSLFANSISATTTADEEQSSEYEKYSKVNPVHVIWLGPIIEELTFRGFLEPLLESGLASLKFSSPYLISALVTSMLFGAYHFTNGYDKDSACQAILATSGGAFQSLLKYNFGLPASISAHITNNFLAWHLMQNEHPWAQAINSYMMKKTD